LDGSGVDRAIGVAMVLYRDRVEKKTLKKHLGSEDHHTIFEEEVVSLLLA